MGKQIHPVYEFRPLPDFFAGDFRRYAEGKWIPDDGEYDLAFIGNARADHFITYSCCLYVQTSYHENIICSWLTTHWSGSVAGHPRGNAWHYALRDGTKEWGDARKDYYNSPNRRAGDSGSNKMASERGGCNGRSVEFKFDDPHIAAGLLRNRDTKEVFSWPSNLTCMYCGHTPQDEKGFRKSQLQKRIMLLESQLSEAQAELAATES